MSAMKVADADVEDAGPKLCATVTWPSYSRL
jgi:hypothetical protein